MRSALLCAGMHLKPARRSIVHDLECEVILSHAASISMLADAFVDDMAGSVELQLPALAHLRWWQRAAARVALWFKRML